MANARFQVHDVRRPVTASSDFDVGVLWMVLPHLPERRAPLATARKAIVDVFGLMDAAEYDRRYERLVDEPVLHLLGEVRFLVTVARRRLRSVAATDQFGDVSVAVRRCGSPSSSPRRDPLW